MSFIKDILIYCLSHGIVVRNADDSHPLPPITLRLIARVIEATPTQTAEDVQFPAIYLHILRNLSDAEMGELADAIYNFN